MKVTVTNLAQASMQDVLDTVGAHLLKQGRRALNAGGYCQYRTNDGLSCAAGCLIPKSRYRPHMENSTWRSLIERVGFSDNHTTFISSLQDIHDSAHPRDWRRELQDLARGHHLNLGAIS